MQKPASADAKRKPKYEPPVAVALGELARGHGGKCALGGDNTNGRCTAGTQNQTGGGCNAGNSYVP